MKVMTWNVNGIKTLLQYAPWNALKTYENILNELGADIICFQETKITKKQVDRGMAVLPSFDSFFSSYARKPEKGYSGTCVFTKKATCVPVRAEEGISGLLPRERRPEPTADEFIGDKLGPDNIVLNILDVKTVDLEGRTTMIDFGLFVLINCYFPNETNEERLDFKLAFNAMFEARVLSLVRQGRHVLALGDVNIAAQPIDHCDPVRRSSESPYGGYELHPARKWFNEFVGPNGTMIDLSRHFYPNRKSMFTHWETRINARETNYGTRIDYILATPGLLPWIKTCDIQPHILGSDHCPVVAEFHDSIVNENGETLLLWDKINPTGRNKDPNATAPDPPKLAAKNYPEFSSEQRKLSNFFGKGANAPVRPPTERVSSPHAGSSAETVALGAVESVLNTTAQGVAVSERVSLGVDNLSSTSVTDESVPSAGHNASSTPAQLLSPSIDLTSEHSGDEVNGNGQTIPTKGEHANAKLTKKKVKKGQQRLSSFFKPPTPAPDSAPRKAKRKAVREASLASDDQQAADAQEPIASTSALPDATVSAPTTQAEPIEVDDIASLDGNDGEADGEADVALNELRNKATNGSRLQGRNGKRKASLVRVESGYDDADMQEAVALADNSQSSSSWSSIFVAKVPPLCTMHEEPCKQWTVNKSGPNKGRVFWLCARPVGEGYDQGQSKALVNPEFRCNYFKWESDLKRNASSSAAKKRKPTPGGG